MTDRSSDTPESAQRDKAVSRRQALLRLGVTSATIYAAPLLTPLNHAAEAQGPPSPDPNPTPGPLFAKPSCPPPRKNCK